MNVGINLYSVEAWRVAISNPRRAGRRIRYEIGKVLNFSKIGRVCARLGLRLRNAVLRGKPIVVDVAGHVLRLVPEGAVAESLWFGKDREGAEVALICRLLCKDSVFLDIGANVGIFSLAASDACPSSTIFAFEPTGKTFERLSQNILLNEARNVRPTRFALGDVSGQATLNLNVSGKDGLNTIGKATHEDSEIVGTETVPVTTLDDFVEEHAVPQIDVMKIDTEGAELLVFRGAAKLLAKPNAPLILYEGGSLSKGFGYHPVESMWLLEKHGYSFFVIDSKTGKISIPAASRAYDAMVIAVKPSHAAYNSLQELSR